MSSLENKFSHWLLNRIVWFLLLSCMSSLYVLDTKPLSDKRKVKVKLLSRVWLFATPWTVAYQAPPSMGFSRHEYWSGFHFLLQRIFLTQGSNLGLLHCRQMLYGLSHQGSLLSDIWFANIFSHTVGCFFILLICRSFLVWCSPTFFLFLIWLQCMWELNPPTRDWTHAPALEERRKS